MRDVFAQRERELASLRETAAKTEAALRQANGTISAFSVERDTLTRERDGAKKKVASLIGKNNELAIENKELQQHLIEWQEKARALEGKERTFVRFHRVVYIRPPAKVGES